VVRNPELWERARAWVGTGDVFRLCLDLNVWYADYRGGIAGHRDTACQVLVQAARAGLCALGPTQLVISWGMLSRLRTVLERKGVPPTASAAQIKEIAAYARYGPAGDGPYVLLGGTGTAPLRDAEDVHVLDTAVAGDAHVLATANFDDFISYRTEIVKPGLIAIHEGPRQPLIIAHPFEVVRWTREGRIAFD